MQRRYSEWEIETNGVTTVVSEWGAGERVIVLVHGISGNRSLWGDIAQRLAGDGYRVLAPDMRGCGDTIASGDQIGRTMEVYVDDLAAWTSALGLENFILGGHSLGGRLAIDFAHKYPGRAQKLVLIAPAGPDAINTALDANPALRETTPTGTGRFDHLKAIEGTTLEALHKFSTSHPTLPLSRSVIMRWLTNMDIDDSGQARYIDAHDTIAAMMNIWTEEDQTERLASVQTPTVVMRSTDEGDLLRYTIPHYVDHLPNVRYVDDVKADHGIPSTNPDAVIEALVG